MKNLMANVALFVISLTVFATAGTAIYKWLKLGDRVACTANENTFGCSTTLGWVLSASAVVVMVGAIGIW